MALFIDLRQIKKVKKMAGIFLMEQPGLLGTGVKVFQKNGA